MLERLYGNQLLILYFPSYFTPCMSSLIGYNPLIKLYHIRIIRAPACRLLFYFEVSDNYIKKYDILDFPKIRLHKLTHIVQGKIETRQSKVLM